MKQKGQGIVEFALVVPMLAALGIAIVYIGIMFLDYTQYSNAARDAARDISLQTKFITDETLDTSARSRKADAMRQDIADALNGGSNFEDWFNNFLTLPDITYKMVLEE
jgi:Flp pilus assembly protein TadG